jgi:hypothetical protein
MHKPTEGKYRSDHGLCLANLSHLHISLGGFHRAVSHHVLYIAAVCAALQHVCSETMPEHVRVHLPSKVLMAYSSHAGLCISTATLTFEQVRCRAVALIVVAKQ